MALIKPTIYSDILTAKFAEKLKLGALAVNLGYLTKTNVGETVSFPKFKPIGEATDVEKGTPVGTESLDQEETTATIKMVAPKGVKIYDIDDMTALGNHIEEAAKQQATVIARKLDKDLADEALTTDLKVATNEATLLSAFELNQGLALFGDEQDTEDFAGIVVNSKLLSSLLGMDEFVSADKTYATQGNGIIHNGLIGYYRGIPVFLADHCTYDTTTQECVSYIIKKGALAYMPKRDITVEELRVAGEFASTVYSNMVYAVKLVNDEGVVVLRKTIA